MAVAHLALDLRLGDQRRDRVDNDDVDRTGADQVVRDFEGLLAVVGLRDQEGIVVIAVVALSMVMLVGHDISEEEKQSTKTEQLDQPKQKKNFVEKMFHRADTWKSRLMKFGKPKPTPQEYDLDKDAQVAHANIAIVNSNIIGRGPGQSEERDFLPQAFSDFIFVIIIEELGIIGAAFVVLLYIVLLFRSARIASRCENNFPAFLILGLALMLVIQATFNMLVAVGIAPVTGQPLPLISRGGTSTIINCAYIGAILSVSRSAKKKSDNLALKEI